MMNTSMNTSGSENGRTARTILPLGPRDVAAFGADICHRPATW
jgi:hypothetical protein